MAKSKSRPQRWQEAAGVARAALDAIKAAKDELSGALQDLEDIRGEYEEWRDNLPDFAQGSALADKLDAMADMDIDPETDDLEEAERMVEEAEGADLPLGFGRD